MSDGKNADISTLFPNLPGWHKEPFLPVLISLANSVEEVGRAAAIDRLLEETMITPPWVSRHDEARVRGVLGSLSYSDAEIAQATQKEQESEKSWRATHRSALRIGLAGGHATPQTIHILRVVAESVEPFFTRKI